MHILSFLSQLEFPTDLPGVIVWLASPLAAGFVISHLLERWQWFAVSLSPQWRGKVIMAVFVGLPWLAKLGAWALVRVDPAQLAVVGGVVATLIQGLMAWSVSQYAHATDPKAIERAKE